MADTSFQYSGNGADLKRVVLIRNGIKDYHYTEHTDGKNLVM